MDSPQHVGDTTAHSISSQLSATHLRRPSMFSASALASAVSSAVFLGQKFIQITLTVAAHPDKSVLVLRRVQDSYVNVSQMLRILVLLNIYTQDQIDAFLNNDVFSSTQYLPQGALALYNDFSSHEVPQIRGLWIPYDKAILIAVRLDIYELIKKLFLVDVHDFDLLRKTEPNAVKRAGDDDPAEPDTPAKRRKSSLVATPPALGVVKAAAAANTNHPYCLPPLVFDEKLLDLVAEVKLKFSEIFKNDGKDTFSADDVAKQFKLIFEKCKDRAGDYSAVLDVPLDLLGKTALHYASTLASINLVKSFIELRICSPIRGDNKGESALIAIIQVTNAMEKGNFVDMLGNWLWPNLWLFDSKHQSILHHLVGLATKNFKSSKFYLSKIVEWMISNPDKEKNLYHMCHNIINAQETQTGNTALHLAGEHELKWFVFVLLELKADPSLSNNVGVKPTDFECVKQIMELRSSFKANVSSSYAVKMLLDALDVHSESDEYLLLLLRTGVEFLEKLSLFREVGEMEDDTEAPPKKEKELTPTSEVVSSSLLSSKILKSIQDLLENTNTEYEEVIHTKKKEINSLNKELRDATIITANNRFIAKKIMEKVSLVDTMKLQMTNINDKVQMLKKDLNSTEGAELEDEDPEHATLVKFDADEPFIIRPIYDQLVNNADAEPEPTDLELLPSAEVLKARLKAYNEVNSNLQLELDKLRDYSVLTAKFKKVVSFCTGVDINEVDELLDGLLEAVESQQ